MISFIYLTNRKISCVEWVCDSFCNQWGIDPIAQNDAEFIFVDRLADEDWRKKEFELAVRGRFQYKHVTPKPCVWQGKYRKTKEDWFAASNARNTGIMLARGSYVVFIDDLSVLCPGWLNQVRHAAHHNYLVLGAYKKVFDLKVNNGNIVSYIENPNGIDSRWSRGSDSGIVEHPHSDLFGCSFGCPISNLLFVNGLSEQHDGTSAEDTDLGIRLGRTGIKCFYNRNMLTLEDDHLHSQGPIMRREARPTSSGMLSDWFLYYQSTRTNIVKAKNPFNIKDVRSHVLSGGGFPIPTEERDWATGKLFSEL